MGGIAGENRGLITNCTNRTSVNTDKIEVTSEKSFGFTALSDLKEIKKDVSEVSEDDFLNISDIGGIAGLSTGITEGCVNSGNVGYEHMGYNVGGIAGRSSGRLAGCENTGTIYGRKDVGGIAGQIEPFACWDFSDSKVAELDGQLGDLQDKVSNMIDNGETKSADVRASLKTINDELKAARNELAQIKAQTSGDISASEKSIKPILKKSDDVDRGQMSLFDTVTDEEIIREIRELDCNNLTPMEALNALNMLQSKLKNRW